MVCSWALQVRNQTVVIMNLRSLYHYHAEWPLKAEPWINAEGCVSPQRRGSKLSCCCCCCCTQQPLPPAQDHCSESADLCLGSHQVSEGPLAGAGSTGFSFKTVLTMFKDAEVQTLYFSPTSSLCWQFETSPECLSCSAAVPFVPHSPVITDTLLTAQESRAYLCSNPTAIKAHIKIKSAWSAMLPLSPLSPATLLFPLTVYTLQLSRLWHRQADATPETDSILMTTGC